MSTPGQRAYEALFPGNTPWAELTVLDQQRYENAAQAARARKAREPKAHEHHFMVRSAKVIEVVQLTARWYRYNRRLVRMPDGTETRVHADSLHKTRAAAIRHERKKASDTVKQKKLWLRIAERELKKAKALR